MQVVRYDEKYKADWDALISDSRNGTFLFVRDYMDYHSDRFQDCSLLFEEKGRFVGALPANIENCVVYSHGGLTYGGLVVRNAEYAQIKEMMDLAIVYFRQELKASKLIYKPVPSIYFCYPAEEDLFWLFQHKARLTARGLSSAIDLRGAYAFSELRRRKVSKARKSDILIKEARTEGDWESFWEILTEVLQTYHHLKPVHSLEEISLLRRRFPTKIRLFLAQKEGHTIAGTVIFHTRKVVHAQYIASNEEGRECGALDLLFYELLESDLCRDRNFFDFGISSEQGGQILNEGLLFQKEGFGGRGICYDRYELPLSE